MKATGLYWIVNIEHGEELVVWNNRQGWVTPDDDEYPPMIRHRGETYEYNLPMGGKWCQIGVDI